jgi:hypothetical protein
MTTPPTFHIENIEPGMYIIVTRGLLCTRLDGSTFYDRSFQGSALRVEAIQHPFIAVRRVPAKYRWDAEPITLNIYEVELMILSEAMVQALVGDALQEDRS